MLNENYFNKQKVFRQSYLMFSIMDKNSDRKITEVEFVKVRFTNKAVLNVNVGLISNKLSGLLGQPGPHGHVGNENIKMFNLILG